MTRRARLSIAGGVLALTLAVLLAWELPAAGALGARTARSRTISAEAASLSRRTTALAGSEESARKRLVVVTAQESRLRRREHDRRTTIDGLHRQIASLNRDIASLGG